MSLSQNESKVVSWYGRNNNGDFLPTGIYLVAAYNNNKSKGVTKLAVIRK